MEVMFCLYCNMWRRNCILSCQIYISRILTNKNINYCDNYCKPSILNVIMLLFGYYLPIVYYIVIKQRNITLVLDLSTLLKIPVVSVLTQIMLNITYGGYCSSQFHLLLEEWFSALTSVVWSGCVGE